MVAYNSCLRCSYSLEDYPKVPILQSTLIALLILPTIIGNLLVIILIRKFRNLHTRTSVLLLNLSIADCGVGIFVTPFAFLNSLSTSIDELNSATVLCKISGVLNFTFCLASISTLTAISIERYYAITQPLYYHKIVTRQKMTLALIFTWTYSFIWSIIPFGISDQNYVFFQDNYVCILDFAYLKIFSSLLSLFCFMIPLIIITFCYLSIYKIARKQLKQIHDIETAVNRRNTESSFQVEISELSCNSRVENREQGERRRSSRFIMLKSRKSNQMKSNKTIKDLKAAFTLFIIMAIYIAGWLPYNLGIACHVIETCKWQCSYYRVSTILVFASSMCNPIVYIIRFKQYRKYLKRLFRCRERNRSIAVIELNEGIY
ncbi:beta-2 adrenergic receptor-like [Anneissia japonica]|uniref:beta-2 adrenergic receptor-like n=1 Tax=Anneissia japonica TaxID=1529436 RepID=UPI001425B60C|nr:beta-2 adrenergic receptor-like [Anneissia japonica]